MMISSNIVPRRQNTSWGKPRRRDPKTIECPKVATFGAPTCAMIRRKLQYDPHRFREKKTREIERLLEKLSSLDDTSFSPENKDRLFRTYQRQLVRRLPFCAVHH
jgi:hypothetical protein